MDLKLVKFINQSSKDLVIGYIKLIQQLLPQQSSYVIISEPIIHICTLYTFWTEYFSEIGNGMQLSGISNDIISLKKVNDYCTALGNINIDFDKSNNNCTNYSKNTQDLDLDRHVRTPKFNQFEVKL